MKKLKLRKWVKVVLLVTLFIVLIKINTEICNDAINQCIKEGNDVLYCQRHLG